MEAVFQDPCVGDKVKVVSNDRRIVVSGVIEKVTPKQIVIGGVRYWRENGRAVSMDDETRARPEGKP